MSKQPDEDPVTDPVTVLLNDLRLAQSVIHDYGASPVARQEARDIAVAIHTRIEEHHRK